MRISESGAALTFAVLAFLTLIVAAMAHTAEYAFHTALFSICSIAAVFAIVDHYYKRPAHPEPLSIDGKPN